jgi:hypothetical protein
MTGYESKKAAALAKTIDEVNWVDHEPNGVTQPVKTLTQDIDAPLTLNGVALWPKRPWVGLTEENLKSGDAPYFVAWREGARWAEAYLKDKNT